MNTTSLNSSTGEAFQGITLKSRIQPALRADGLGKTMIAQGRCIEPAIRRVSPIVFAQTIPQTC